MSLDTTQSELDIVTRLKTVIPRVYETEVPDGTVPIVYPLIVVYFGEPTRTGRDRGIVSTRNDTLRAFCTVQIQAKDASAARVIANKVRTTMTGYRPTDCGEMVLEGGSAYPSSAASIVQPTIYYREIGYSWLTNLSYNA